MTHIRLIGRSMLRALAAGIAWTLCSPAIAQGPAPKGPSPSARQQLDPLNMEERQSAERIAAADGRVRELTSKGRVQLIYIEFANPKPENGEAVREPPAGRFAEVLQYRYDDDSGVRTLVDLQRKAVVAVERVEGSSVPLTRPDLDYAVRLALESAEVRELLGKEAQQYVVPTAAATRNPPYAIRALLVHSQADDDPCFRRRCVHLFFQRHSAYLTDAAIVDLTERRVRIEKGTR